jgi:hypothetical protein
MTDSLKDRLSSDLQKAKTEGGTRATRIREILKGAATQSLVEVKDGAAELRSIALQSVDTLKSDTSWFSAIATRCKTLDAKLTARYGDRYELIKQRLIHTRLWYKNAKANAEATGIVPLQQKQVELETKAGDTGTFVAQKEQQIKQQVQETWQSVISRG